MKKTFFLLFLVVLLLAVSLCGCNSKTLSQKSVAGFLINGFSTVGNSENDSTSVPEATSSTVSTTIPPMTTSFSSLWHSEEDFVAVTDYSSYPVVMRQYQTADATLTMFHTEQFSAGLTLFELPLSDVSGTISMYDPEHRIWSESPFAEGIFIGSIIKIYFDDGTALFCDTPKSYERLESGVIHQTGVTSAVNIIKQDDGSYTLACRVASTGDFCDCTIYCGPMGRSQPVENAQWDDCADIWAYYTNTDVAKWCFDGYYRTSPTSYYPTGPDCYYRCSASYIIRLMWEQLNKFPEAKLLMFGTLDTVMRNQNELGCWSTEPCCDWLTEDYQVSSNFFDTRFNSDLIEYTYNICQSLNTILYEDHLDAYGDYFLSFASDNHRETANGGWLVSDYGCQSEHLLSHTSLNHQVTEILTILHLSDLLQRSDLKDLANKMLQAIRDTCDDWIKENHDLYYRSNPDGTYGGEDYPRLTFNDLSALQNYLVQHTGESDDAIATLISEKWSYICNSEN